MWKERDILHRRCIYSSPVIMTSGAFAWTAQLTDFPFWRVCALQRRHYVLFLYLYSSLPFGGFVPYSGDTMSYFYTFRVPSLLEGLCLTAETLCLISIPLEFPPFGGFVPYSGDTMSYFYTFRVPLGIRLHQFKFSVDLRTNQISKHSTVLNNSLSTFINRHCQSFEI
jgi:hypothetical protein